MFEEKKKLSLTFSPVLSFFVLFADQDKTSNTFPFLITALN